MGTDTSDRAGFAVAADGGPALGPCQWAGREDLRLVVGAARAGWVRPLPGRAVACPRRRGAGRPGGARPLPRARLAV